MYENMTFESILKRMLDKIPNTFDKREGSIIYDALAPAAIELQNMYIELDFIMNESFADTASRDSLIKMGKERGITPDPATNAILKGVFTPKSVDVLGKRFNCDKLNYIVIGKITDGEYKIKCETVGVDGNTTFGHMIPIEYIEGLETAELTDILIPGEDEEDTEVFRERYLKSFGSQAFGGNIADYKVKTNAIDGVGGVKVTPVWKGGGTVKLTIIDSEFEAPSEELLKKVQNEIDPVNYSGKGEGLAPIGHIVTVEGCIETTVNIQTNIKFREGWDWDSAKSSIQTEIDGYFTELSKTWDSLDETEGLLVLISQIEARLVGLSEIVSDVTGTTLNNVAKNLCLEKDNIPVRGSITCVTES